MGDDIDPTKKEQERLMRAMNKGRRGGGNARPVSWNVHLTGRAVTGAASKSEQEEALRLLQEQVKEEGHASPALSVAATNAASAEQPFHKKPSPAVSPRNEILSPPLNLEDQAELNAFNAFNEQRELERINKWTKVGGKSEPTKKPEVQFEKPIPAVLMRQFDVEAHATHTEPKKEEEHIAQQDKIHDLAQYQEGIVKFTNNVTVAAKALRQRNSEALVRSCWAVVLSAKTLALLANDDADVISWTKALEGTTNLIRTRVDSGGNGQEHYNELSNLLGQLYLSVVSLQ